MIFSVPALTEVAAPPASFIIEAFAIENSGRGPGDQARFSLTFTTLRTLRPAALAIVDFALVCWLRFLRSSFPLTGCISFLALISFGFCLSFIAGFGAARL